MVMEPVVVVVVVVAAVVVVVVVSGGRGGRGGGEESEDEDEDEVRRWRRVRACIGGGMKSMAPPNSAHVRARMGVAGRAGHRAHVPLGARS